MKKLLRDNVSIKGRILVLPSLHTSEMFAGGPYNLSSTWTWWRTRSRTAEMAKYERKLSWLASICVEIRLWKDTPRSEKIETSLCRCEFSQEKLAVICPTLISLIAQFLSFLLHDQLIAQFLSFLLHDQLVWEPWNFSLRHCLSSFLV